MASQVPLITAHVRIIAFFAVFSARQLREAARERETVPHSNMRALKLHRLQDSVPRFKLVPRTFFIAFFSIVPRLSRKIVLGSRTISLGVIARHRQQYYSNVIPLHKYANTNFVYVLNTQIETSL